MYKPVVDKHKKWAEDKKKDCETKAKLIDEELKLMDAEICLEEAIEELDELLKQEEKEEQRKAEMGLSKREKIDDIAEEIPKISIGKENKKAPEQEDEGKEADEEEDDDDDGDDEPDDGTSSFGTTALSQNGQEGKQGASPFSAITLSVAPCGLLSCVSAYLGCTLLSWKGSKSPLGNSAAALSSRQALGGHGRAPDTVRFPPNIHGSGCLRAVRPEHLKRLTRITPLMGSASRLHSLSRTLSCQQSASSKHEPAAEQRGCDSFLLHEFPDGKLSRILSLQNPLLSSDWDPEYQWKK
ncbi:hypothetical protein MLD38_040795 [Melastoma candidum]|nr:hypothetical protein MLD38_040795 [Melastoma candidum]